MTIALSTQARTTDFQNYRYDQIMTELLADDSQPLTAEDRSDAIALNTFFKDL